MGSLILHRMNNFTDFVFLLNLIKTPNTECGENLKRSLSLCCVGRLNRIEREGPCLPWAMTWLDMTWQDQLLFQPCHCVHQPMPNIFKSYPLKLENMKIWQNICAHVYMPRTRIYSYQHEILHVIIHWSHLLGCLLNFFPFMVCPTDQPFLR